MRKSPNVAVGRAASDATTAEPSVFVAGSLASQSPNVASRCMRTHMRMHIHASCIQPTSRHTPIFNFLFVDSRGAGNSN